MSLVIKIDVAGNAEPGVKRITTELGKSAAAMQSAGAEMKRLGETSSAAGKKAADAFKAAKREVDALVQGGLGAAAGAFSKLTDVFEREARVLERIRGPMREYYSDLVALDQLHRRGALSVAEFNAEMERLTRSRRAGNAEQAASTIGLAVPQRQESGPGLGSGIGVVMGAAAALGIDAAIGKVENLIDGYFRLKDVYIEASNSAIKFADSTHTVDQVLSEQIALAHDLHSNYKTTTELYDSVRDGTDELNVSHGEQIRLLRSLSETAMLSGKSLESVGGTMSKFSYALASGRIEQRSLRAMMTEMPELANVWIAKFGGSRDAVLRMMKDGRIGTEDLMMALIEQSKAVDVLDANYKKITNTEEQMKESFEANVKLFRSQGDTSNASVTQRAVEFFRGQGDTFSDPIVKAQQAAAGLGKTWADVATAMIDKAGDVSAAWERAHQELNSSQRALLASIKDPIEAGKVAIDNLNKLFSLGKVSIEEYDKAYSGLVAQVGNSKEVLRLAIEGPIEAAKKGLADLKEVIAEGGGNAVDNWKKYKELATALNHGELPETIKLWESLRAPARQYGLTMAAINSLYERGSISLRQYNDQLLLLGTTQQELAKLHPSGERDLPGYVGPRKIGGLGVAVSNEFVDVKQGPLASVTGGRGRGLDQISQQYLDNIDIVMRWKQAQADVVSVLHGTSEEQAIAAEVLATLTGFEERLIPITKELTAQVDGQIRARREAVELFGREQQILEAIAAPQKAYADQLAAIEALHSRLTAEQYAQQIDRVRAAYLAASVDGKTFAGGMEAVWLKMKAEAESFGATVANTLVSDLDKLNNSLVTAANGGKVAWGDMVDSMIEDLERMLLKQLEVLAITALLNAYFAGSGTLAQQTGATGAAVDYANATRSSTTTPAAYPTSAPGGGGGVANIGTSSRSGGGATPGAPVIVQNRIYNIYDRSVGVAAISSPEGVTAIVNLQRANGGAFRNSGSR